MSRPWSILTAVVMAAALLACGEPPHSDADPSMVVTDTPGSPGWTGPPAPDGGRLDYVDDDDDEDALMEANRREFERRAASMGSFDRCMADARDLPDHARQQIEAACHRMPDAPR